MHGTHPQHQFPLDCIQVQRGMHELVRSQYPYVHMAQVMHAHMHSCAMVCLCLLSVLVCSQYPYVHMAQVMHVNS